jgi:hypothetical protein
MVCVSDDLRKMHQGLSASLDLSGKHESSQTRDGYFRGDENIVRSGDGLGDNDMNS